MIAKNNLVVLGVLILLVGCGRKQTPFAPLLQTRRAGVEEPPQVDRITRAKASKLHAQDIAELRFTGVQFMRFGDNPIIIKDKQEIGRYITALRHSYCRSLGFANGIDSLEIVFAPRNGKEEESQLFFFNLSNDLDCFGPEFRKEAQALQARTAQQDKNAHNSDVGLKGDRLRPVAVTSGGNEAGVRSASFVPARLFSISNVKNNAVLSGEVPVNLATSNTYTYGDVTLKVDGSEVGWCGSTLTIDGSGRVPFAVATDVFTNGKHTLTVQDKLGNTDTRTVIFRNEFEKTSVDPIFDVTPGVTDVPRTCTITATLAHRQPWTVRIENTDDAPVTVRTFSGNSAHIHVVWDGKDARGREAANEPHDVVFACQKQTLRSVTNKDRVGP